jgi:hypothetical protein
MRLVCVNAMLCCLWISAATGCVASPAGSATGEISINLKGTVPSGVIYRLRNAVITVDGPSSAEFRTEDDPDRTSLSANVVVGDYTAVLHDGWTLEKHDGTVTTVTATLISDNPVSFTVAEHQRTSVPLRFRVPDATVDLTQGYDIVLTVEEVVRGDASADASVRSDEPDTNFGADSRLFVFGSGPGFDVTMRSLIEFDLASLPANGPLRGAFLRVRMVDQGGDDFRVAVHQVLAPWSEAGVTWNNQPPFSSDIEVSVDYQDYTWWRFDVTALVQRWVAAPESNHGLLLRMDREVFPPNTGSFARFNSREADRPYLELVFGNELN